MWDGEDHYHFYGIILDPNQTFLFMVKSEMLISIFLFLERLDIRKFVHTTWGEILDFLIRSIAFLEISEIL